MTLEQAQADLEESGVRLIQKGQFWYAVRAGVVVAGPFPTWRWAWATLRGKAPF